MKFTFSDLRGATAVLAAGLLSPALALGLVGGAAAETLGQPSDGGMDLQPGVTVIRDHQLGFHNGILLPIITGITLLVLALLIIVIVRFNKRANPTPARWSHNTPVEIIWTVAPVLILMFIAIFSFKLLFEEHDMPRPDMTVKVVGRQWNWDYAYPEQKIAAYTALPLDQGEAEKAGKPYMLGTDNPLVVPVGKVVRVQVTAEDVIHDWSVPAFGIKIDAVPGRLNETWFKAEHTGVFYGQCDQLCGMNHSYMPIEVKVVSQPDFDAWVASKAPKKAAVVASAAPAAAGVPAATVAQ